MTSFIKKLAGMNNSGSDLRIGVDFSVNINPESAESPESNFHQILGDLEFSGKIGVEKLE